MRKMKLLKVVGIMMMVVTLVTGMGTTNVFAAELDATSKTVEAAEVDGDIETRSGVETIPLNQWYMISRNFSIDGYNYTPCKTVTGQYLKLRIRTYLDFSEDKGTGPVKVTIKMRDYNSRQFIPETEYTFTLERGQVYVAEPTFNLRDPRRKIQIYTEITSINASDPSTRVLNFYDYEAYSYND